MDPNAVRQLDSVSVADGPADEDLPGLEIDLAGEEPESSSSEPSQPERVPVAELGPPRLRGEDLQLSDREAGLRFREILRFHASSQPSREQSIDADLLPAPLHAFRSHSNIRTSYPLFLWPEGTDSEGRLCMPIADYLVESTEKLFPGPDSARILKDNLPRLELLLSQALVGVNRPRTSEALFEAAKVTLLAKLALKGENHARLSADLDTLIAAVPADGALLSFGEHASCHLMFHAARHRIPARRRVFRVEVEKLCQKLRQLMEVERQKTEAARSPNSLGASAGSMAQRFLDMDALSGVLGPHRGSEPMYYKRRDRIEGALATLQEYLADKDIPLLTLIHDGRMPRDWVAGDDDIRIVRSSAPCLMAAELFDEQAAGLAKVIRAARIARLETSGEFDPSIDKPLLNDVTWESFTDDELRLLPPIVALESPDTLVGQGMVSLSRLLVSGRPVQVLVRLISTGSPGVRTDQDPLAGFRIELGFLGILALMTCYALFVWRGIIVARAARSYFGMLVVACITILLGVQALLNLAVVLGMVPPKGLVLPFVSYGGSAIIAHLWCVGIVLSISMERRRGGRRAPPLRRPVGADGGA